ncbi:hypothetical protein PQ125_002607 [Salmonella enterica]|nr:hypothetical protein [Salmonella enterica]
MKKLFVILAIAISSFASVNALAKEDSDKSGNSNGATAQMRNIDACVKGEFNGTVKSYDNVSHVKPCTAFAGEWDRKPVPEQKVKAPFR